MINIGGNFILSVAPKFSGTNAHRQREIVNAIANAFSPTLERYQINNKLRIAHFMAQVTHECAGFRTTEEFASGAAYEGRADLGNVEKGDGLRFKGRGLIQLTGRDNYRRYGQRLGLPLEQEPTLAAEPVTSLIIACEYWQDRNINHFADQDNLIKTTKLVNGGLNGLADRRKYLQKAKEVLTDIEVTQLALSEDENIVLRRGMVSDEVGELQQLLVNSGYRITIDNHFGPGTEFAVVMFQKRKGLVADGIVGKQTWNVLR